MSAQSTKPVICIVTPCFNEEEVVELFRAEVERVFSSIPDARYQILFVDDGSTDRTLEILTRMHQEDEHVGVYSLSRNFGNQVAITAGLDAADADAVVMMDCDLQHPPSLIPEMIERWQAGTDVVSTVRVTNESVGFLKHFTSSLFYRVFNFMSDTPIAPNSTDFCLLSRKALDALRAMPERHRFLRGMVAWIGFKRESIEFEAPPRAAGTTKYSWQKLTTLAFTAIYSFSARPLRLAMQAGLGIATMGMLYLIFIIVVAIFFPQMTVPGWASVICVSLILGGVQLVFTGLIGEYIARLYEEAKGRPTYFLKEAKQPREID